MCACARLYSALGCPELFSSTCGRARPPRHPPPPATAVRPRHSPCQARATGQAECVQWPPRVDKSLHGRAHTAKQGRSTRHRAHDPLCTACRTHVGGDDREARKLASRGRCSLARGGRALLQASRASRQASVFRCTAARFRYALFFTSLACPPSTCSRVGSCKRALQTSACRANLSAVWDVANDVVVGPALCQRRTATDSVFTCCSAPACTCSCCSCDMLNMRRATREHQASGRRGRSSRAAAAAG